MICHACGVQFPQEASFCPSCGAPISPGAVFQDEPLILYPGSQPPLVASNMPQSNAIPSSSLPYPAYPYGIPAQPPYAASFPPPMPPGKPKKKTGLIIGIVILLFVLISASGCIYLGLALRNSVVTNLQNSNATATADGTNSSNSTNPTATVTDTSLPNPYTSLNGNLTLEDPLSDNSQGHQWVEGSATGTCQFTSNAYHITIPQSAKPLTESCAADNTVFTDFTFQVEMTIIKGHGGGITFRNQGRSQYYYFYITRNGTYGLALFSLDATSQSSVKTLTTGSNAAIQTDLGKTNVIAVVANNSTIDLYANQTRLASFTDSTYSEGRIGVAAHTVTSLDTDVMFQNAKVWE